MGRGTGRLLRITSGGAPGTRTVETPYGPVEITAVDARALLQFTEQHVPECDRHAGTAGSDLWKSLAPRPLAQGQPSAVRLACHGPVFGLALVTHRSGGMYEPSHRLVDVDPLALLIGVARRGVM